MYDDFPEETVNVYDELERDHDETYEYERGDDEYYMDEGEYDGQPDEAQEWYDFDPDC